MKKFEYKILNFSELERLKKPLDAALNELGQEGWEYCGKIRDRSWLFKRELITA